MKSLRYSRHFSRFRAFTLMELLVTLSIMSCLLIIAVNATHGIFGAHFVDSAAYTVSEMVELARNEAITRQTYVWLGCANADGSDAPGLLLTAVCSIDGSTDTTPTNLLALSKTIYVKGVRMTDWAALKAATRTLFTNAVPESLNANASGISFKSGNTTFSGTTITFTPSGEALLTGTPALTDGYTSNIDISIRQAHGTVVAANADDAAIIVDGATGNPQIVRLQ